MRLIECALADAELEYVERVEGLEAASATFPLADLSPVHFERLNYALFKNSSPVGTPRNWHDAALMPAGVDEGWNILLLGGGTAPGIVQYKSRSADASSAGPKVADYLIRRARSPSPCRASCSTIRTAGTSPSECCRPSPSPRCWWVAGRPLAWPRIALPRHCDPSARRGASSCPRCPSP